MNRMLYYKNHITESTLLGIWKVEENRADLLSLLHCHKWVQNIHTIKAEFRVLEILSARILIKELTGEEKEVCYNDTGKPFLADKSFYISVSHTRNYVAVAVDKDKPVGLDIEYISEKIRRVRSRLISAGEYIDSNNELIHLLLHWSAKEAMFKFLDAERVDFRKHLFVSKFTPEEEGVFFAKEVRSFKETDFKAHYKAGKEFVMVCIEEDQKP
jgi:4'-phosphopantetheinyl transferase EntD